MGNFCEIFRNLHRLGRIRQKELKELFINVYQLQGKRLELARHFKEGHQLVQKKKDSVERLKNCLDDALKALDADSRLKFLKENLPRLWVLISRGYDLAKSTFDEFMKNHNEKLVELAGEEHTLKEALTENKKQRDEALLDCGPLREKVKALELASARFHIFDEQKTKKELAEFRTQIEQLTYQIESVKEAKIELLTKEVAQLEIDLAEIQKAHEHLPRLVATRLQGFLHSEEIRQAFRILNPRILSMAVSESAKSDEIGSVIVKNTEKLSQTLRAISDHIENNQYEDSEVKLELHPLALPELEAYDLSRLKEKISNIEEQLGHRRRILTNASKLNALEEERSTLATRADNLDSQVKAFTQWKIDKLNEVALREQHESVTKKIKDLSDEEQAIRNDLGKLQERRQKLLEAQEQTEETLTILKNLIHSLTPTPIEHLDASELSPRVPSGAAFHKLIEQYREESSQLESCKKERDNALARVESSTYGEYPGGGTNPLEKLRDAVDGLPGQEAAVEVLWNNLIVGVKAALKELVAAVDTLEVRITEFNRQINKIRISNLASVEAQIARTDLLDTIKTIVSSQDEPLFAQPDVTKSAITRLKSLLETHPQIDIINLFELGFCVEGAEKRKREFRALDKIESTGTTMTIKIVVNLLFLSNLLMSSDLRIPFYIDEVDSLDDNNLEAILKLAEQLGFIAILASPKPRDNVDAVYYLYTANDHVTLTPEYARVKLHPHQAEMINGPGEVDAMG